MFPVLETVSGSSGNILLRFFVGYGLFRNFVTVVSSNIKKSKSLNSNKSNRSNRCPEKKVFVKKWKQW